MKRTNRLAAICLAFAGSISATIALAGTNTNLAVKPSSTEISQLAAELSKTAARLAELQESQLETEKASEAIEPATPVTAESKTTVHWLSSNSNQLNNNARIDIDIKPAMATDTATGDIVAPRPAATAYREAPRALPATTNSSIVRAQANQDLYYTAQAEQDLNGTLPNDLDAQQSEVPWGDPVVGADGCCDTCCGPGCGCAKCCRRRCILVVGTEAVFLSPTVNGTATYYQFDDFVDPSLQFGPDFGYGAIDDFYMAPRLSVGFQGCRWGIMGRYYHFRAAEHAHNPLVGHGSYGQLANQTINVSNILEAYYTDVEVTRNFCVHGCKGQFGFGCRYALISHDESIYGRSINSDPNSASLIQGGARRNRGVHGTGLTMGINARKPLFCNSCAHWFFSARSSILWGCNHTEVESWADVTAFGNATVPGGSAGSIDGAAASVADDLFIGEIQAGLEWDFALRCLPAKAFFRTAFEYQYWDGSIGNAASGSFAGYVNGGSAAQVSTGSWSPGLIADFVGLSIGTGFTW